MTDDLTRALDAAWRELEMDALASDGPIRDSDVKDAIKRNRPHIEAVLAARSEPRAEILDDSIEGNVQRVDALRVLELALGSQGVPDVNAPSLLRDIEEGGYTLRLTTHDERRRRNENGYSA